MRNRRLVLQALVSIVLIVGLVLPASAVGAMPAVHRPDERSLSHVVMDSRSNALAMTLNTPQGQVTPMIAAGWQFTLGLNFDGTVVGVGANYHGQLDVASWKDIAQVAAGEYHSLGLTSDGTVIGVGAKRIADYGQLDVDSWVHIVQVDAGLGHTVGLRYDGTVIGTGDNRYDQIRVDSWADIVQVAAGKWHTVGLRSDGTVVATGVDNHGQLDVDTWTDIIQVSAGGGHTLGLKADGTVVATGLSSHGQCDVDSWTDIVQLAAGSAHTVAVRSDGTVVAVGFSDGRLNVSGWTDIVQVAAGIFHTAGLKSDGTVVDAGLCEGQTDVASWTEIVQVDAGDRHTVGLRADGTAVAVGRSVFRRLHVDTWTEIVQLAAGGDHTVGLKSDGTVLAIGRSGEGQLDVGSWTDIVQVAAGMWHTVGVRSDGSAVAAGSDLGQLASQTDIVRVDAGMRNTVALKSDGTVVAVGGDYVPGTLYVYPWTDIVQVAEAINFWARDHTVALKHDNTVVAHGNNYLGQLEVDAWVDIVQVAAGATFTVGLKSSGTVIVAGYCNDLEEVNSWTDIVEISAGTMHTVGLKSDGTVVAAGVRTALAKWNLGTRQATPMVTAGFTHTVGLRSDGTVVAVGLDDDGQCDVGDWTNIIQVAAGGMHTVGLKSDRTVRAVGYSDDGQCDVDEWTDVVQVVAGVAHTVGLKANGTVVAVGWDEDGQCNTDDWTDIVQIAAGFAHTVGLKSDRTVVAVGGNWYGELTVDAWTDIVQIAAGGDPFLAGAHTLGLKSDGTVVAAGANLWGELDVDGWTDIAQIDAGVYHSIAVKLNGTVVGAGGNWWGQLDVYGWTDIAQVAAGYYHSVGLKADCTVIAVGDNSAGQCNVEDWNLCEEAPAPGPFKFAIGDWVHTTGNLNVREGPGLGYDVIRTMPLGATAQILGGPILADGFFWWKLEYAVGVIGWSVENWLELHEAGAPTCIVRLQTDGVPVDEIGIWEFFDIYMGHSISDTGIKQVRFSSDHVRDGYPTGRWTDWFDWSASSEDWDATTKTKRWAFDTPGYKEVWAEVKDGNGYTAFGLATILVPAHALPVLTSPLSITPVKDIYNVDDSLEAEFTIVNIGDVPITLDVLTVGGRLNGFIPPGGAPDFTFRSVTLLPNVPYEYQGSLTLEQTGQYRFFIAFHIESPTQDEQRLLDENNWNTCIEIGDGLLHTDRVRSVIVYEEDTVPDDVAQLRSLITSLKSMSTHIPPYLLSDESFGGSVATLWMYWKSFVTDSWEAYDMHYFAGLDYSYLRVKALGLAEDTLDLGNLEQARRLVQMSIDYGKLSSASFRGAFEVYDRNVEQAQVIARFVKDSCQTVVVAGVSAWNPTAGKVLDYAFLCTDYLINRQLIGEEEAKKIAVRDAAVKTVFNFAPIFDGMTLSDYVKAHPAFRFTELQNYIVNSEILPDILYDAIHELMAEGAIELATMIHDMLSSAIQYEGSQTFSPVELRVRDSEGRTTGLMNGEVRHEIPGSLYNDGAVTIVFPLDVYCYEMAGTDEGNYGLTITRVEDGRVVMLTAIDIQTSANALHLYTINWDALAQGEDGITIEKDHDGDGVFDETIETGVPEAPTDPSPVENASGVSLNTTLSWAGDDSGSVTYNVYFGTSMDSRLVSERQSAMTYVPTMDPGTTYYWQVVAINEHGISSTSPLWSFVTEAHMLGQIREVNCSALHGAIVKAYVGGQEEASFSSDDGGNYALAVTEPGAYEVVASKDGFRPETRWVNVEDLEEEYELNFHGDYGLIPNAPDLFYVLDCIDLWLYPPGEECGLSLFRVLDVIDAWLYPVEDE